MSAATSAAREYKIELRQLRRKSGFSTHFSSQVMLFKDRDDFPKQEKFG